MDIGNLDNVFQKKNDKSTPSNDTTPDTPTKKAADANNKKASLDEMMSQVGDYDSNSPTVQSNQDDDSDDNDDANAKEEKEDPSKPDAKTALAAEAVATGTTSK